MGENADQNNSKCGHFLRSDCHEDGWMVAYETIFLSHSQFYKATWFFLVQIQLFRLSLNFDKGSVEHPFPDVNKLNLNNNYKKELSLQYTYFEYFLLSFWIFDNAFMNSCMRQYFSSQCQVCHVIWFYMIPNGCFWH